MSVLLPAPFSPISASTSPARAVSDTSLNAVTPAKRLPMPRISSRSGVGVDIAAMLCPAGAFSIHAEAKKA